MQRIKINSALISVFSKDGLEQIVRKLNELNVKIYSTGGTQTFIEKLGIEVTSVSTLTNYPEIFDGRVKTLHPAVMGGILYRREEENDLFEKNQLQIPNIDLVIVDLYPFEETIANKKSTFQDIIEKIDIGGISLIRAAAKNCNDVVCVPSRDYYSDFLDLLNSKKGSTDFEDRLIFATRGFEISSYYDSKIFEYFSSLPQIEDKQVTNTFNFSIRKSKKLRYGENPHQNGFLFANFEKYFNQLHGKEISYNNLLDIEAATDLMSEFNKETAFGIFKHNNACGFGIDEDISAAYTKALEADPQSAFGGVFIANSSIDEKCAILMDKIFFEIVIAPKYSKESLQILQKNKNRIILVSKKEKTKKIQFRSIFDGVLVQEKDLKTDSIKDFKVVTKREPTKKEIQAMIFASKITKHSKSNCIVLATEDQLLASGVGQTSRVDSLEQAIKKAKKNGFDLSKAVMCSEAFFPFSDCVEIANKEKIKAVIQPGGSIRDSDSINFCDKNNISMIFTNIRHFKH